MEAEADCSTQVRGLRATIWLASDPPHGTRREALPSPCPRTSSGREEDSMTHVQGPDPPGQVGDPRGLGRGGARRAPGQALLRGRARGRRVGAGARPGRRPHPARLPGAADRGEGPRQATARSSSTARAARAARSPRAALQDLGLHERRARWRAASAVEGSRACPSWCRRRSPPSRRALQPAPAGARGRRGGPARSCSTRRCCWWARAASAPPPASTWPRRAWAPSASSTPTWWTSRNLQRQVLHTDGVGGQAQDGVGGGDASARSTPT